ncbi:MAG: hypothetical protein ACJ739_07500 [Acidimicrobiales bacterium]
MRRLAALLAAAVGILLVATPALADEAIPSGSPWGGSTVTRPDAVTSPIVQITITGRIQNNSDLSYSEPIVAVTLSDNPQTGCDLAPAGPATRATLTGPTFTPNTVVPTWKRYAYTADVPFSPERNGDYRVFVCINGERRLDTVAQVRLPAPAVSNLVATASGHEVDLTWDDVRVLAPDLSGYRIERSLGGDFEAVDTIGAESPSYADTSLPPEGGEATYRVIALRPGVADGPASNTAAATYEPGASDPSAPGAGGGAGPGGGGATPSGASAGTSGSSGGSGSRAGSATRPGRSRGPAIKIPRVGTPSRNFFPALLAPPADTGFSEQLPYDVSDGGDELAGEELGGADGASALPGRGLAIPIATGLVLAVWALHLRFLARAARPEYAEGVEILS